MLDTNTVSHLLRRHPAVVGRVVGTPMSSLCISVITESELHYGLARRPEAVRLHAAVHEFLRRVDVLPWTTAVARQYGDLRAALDAKGRTLAPLDLQIAAHALCTKTVLVTNDRTFRYAADLISEDWTK